MLSKKAIQAKLYNLRSVVDAMVTATEADALDSTQALGVISSCLMKAIEENEKAETSGGR